MLSFARVIAPFFLFLYPVYLNFYVTNLSGLLTTAVLGGLTTLGRDLNPSNPHPQRLESVESKIIESCPPLTVTSAKINILFKVNNNSLVPLIYNPNTSSLLILAFSGDIMCIRKTARLISVMALT